MCNYLTSVHVARVNESEVLWTYDTGAGRHTRPDHFSNVVLASKGYPEKYEKGFDITGLNNVKDSIIFQAGTSLTGNKTTTNGGRVLSIVSRDKTFQKALKKSYNNIEKINFEGKTFRKDIGFDL